MSVHITRRLGYIWPAMALYRLAGLSFGLTIYLNIITMSWLGSIHPAQAQIYTDQQVPTSQAQMQLSFAPLVKQTADAVVNVYAERLVQQRSPFSNDPFFERFFGQQFPNRSQRQSSLGSGVVIDQSGIIVTNHHVIEGADDIKVAFSDGREFESRILLKDERVDLAILQINEFGTFPFLEFGDSDALEVGDLVLAIGNPFGVGQTVTSGIVSALARNQVGVADFGFFIQTDAAINPGNSGGALVDMDGRLIGINTAIFSRSGGSNGIGFAIPANMVQAIASAALEGNDSFVRPYLGATFDEVTPDIAESLGLNVARGALVTQVRDNGPAARGGLRPGDVLTTYNGQKIEHPDALGYRLATSRIGDLVELGVISRGRDRTIDVLLEQPPAQAEVRPVLLEGDHPFSGAQVMALNPDLAQRLDMPVNRKGIVIVGIERGSRAARYQFRPRDILVAIGSRPTETVSDLQDILARGALAWRVEVIRGNQRIRQVLR